ncbi:MAG: thioredoxin domain-containing protein [Desulfobacterales bacterium]|nr:MAG: thioredoxin domain-containing protein [Desulfobacterales bacterium]
MAANRLIQEKSPYLLQHAHNPVDWHPWSDETFAKAQAANKPVLLSIGYATCHWCHVMEKESFEDEEAAKYLNETFVCIKVDREERPDIDAVYMAACQMLTGSGGWPLNIFMTPDKKPFFAATYIPKRSRFGRTGLIELCQQVQDLWNSQIDKVQASAAGIAANLNRAFAFKSAAEPDITVLDQAYHHIARSYDPRFGGFEPAPKFPTPHRLLFLLRCHHRTEDQETLAMVEQTLTAMRRGGIWDHVGFGFHRYSTDKEWLVPHFEKMLYDQALIAQAYLETYQLTRNPLFARTAEEIFTYVLRDMTSPQGAFFSAEDADSEGEEGKFYVWTSDDFRKVVGEEQTQTWERIFNLNPAGNFLEEASGRKTGANILHLRMDLAQWAAKLELEEAQIQARWDALRHQLYQVRARRIHPLKDDKILTDWNGLMIAALALGARILDQPAYEDAARRAVRFILDHMRDEAGQLYHRFREGELAIKAQASDYAFLIHGLLNLYQATFDLTYAEQAAALQEEMLKAFWDEDQGGFFLTVKGREELPVRPKDLYDGAIPSANSVALLNMLCLARLTGDSKWEIKAQEQVRAFAGSVRLQPAAFTYFLLGLDFALRPGQEVVIAGERDTKATRRLLNALNLNFAPNKVALLKSDQDAERLAKFAGYTDGLQLVKGQTTAHICRGFACTDPTSDVQTVVEKILGRK